MKASPGAAASPPARPRRVGSKSRDGGTPGLPLVGRQKGGDRDPVANFSAAMKAVREERGMSLTRIAKKLDIAPATLIRFEERGQPVSILVVLQVAEELGVSLELKRK